MARKRKPGRKDSRSRDIRQGDAVPPTAKRFVLDEWAIKRTIGSGAHGTVYEIAHREAPVRHLALKMIRNQLQDDEAKLRFEREVQAIQLAKHKNVVELVDYGLAPDGRCFLVMELLLGIPLQALQTKLQLHQILSIGADVAAALSVAHQSQVIHRDVKPQNILLCGPDPQTAQVKLLDFGIAKILDPDQNASKTATGQWIGTPAYMSPEQWRNIKELDGRVDIYALGITLYELLTGRHPFSGEDNFSWQQQHLHRDVPEPEAFAKLPTDVQSLLRRMLAKDREKRPRQMSEVATELRRLSETGTPATSRVRKKDLHTTTGILLLSFITLTADDDRQDARFVMWPKTPHHSSLVTGLFGDETSTSDAETGFSHTDSKDVPGSQHLTRRAASSANTVRSLALLSHDPLVYGPELDLRVSTASALSIWPGFSNGRETTPQHGARTGNTQPADALTLHLFWRIPVPAPDTTLRIQTSRGPVIPYDSVSAGGTLDSWFHFTTDTITIPADAIRQEKESLTIEARNKFGCLLAAGSLSATELQTESTHYVSMDTPHPRDFLELITESEVLPKDSTNPSGVLLVQDEQNHPLIDCGSRCRCWVPKDTELRFIGLGGDKTAFASWSIPSCKHSSKCIVLESTLHNEEAPIKGRFLSWQASENGWESLKPPPIALTPELQRYYDARVPEDYANPTYLRSVASNRVGEFWSAGRGGVVLKWDGTLHSISMNQLGEADPDAPQIPCQEQGCLIGRTTDFYSISEMSDGSAVVVGHKEYRGRQAHATAFRYHNEMWSQTDVGEVGGFGGAAAIDGKRTLLGVWGAANGSRITAVGYDGFMVDSRLGIVTSADPFSRHLWAITGNRAGTLLLAGGSKQPGKGPIVMLMEPDSVPVIADSLRQVNGKPIPDITLRAAWLSPDGRDVWLGGLSGPLFQFHRDDQGQLSPTTVCQTGALAIRVLAIWGSDRNNVFVASRNQVLHCDGKNPWTIVHSAPVGVELTGITSDPRGEVWTVGFYKAPDTNPKPAGASDFAYIARLRPENRHRMGDMLVPQPQAMTGQSTDQQKGSAD